MSVYVFTGPTLSAEEARTVLDAVYLPPVSQGDVYRVSLRRPSVIGIIDGYFERIPAVWHKEILWAMSHGIHVFGSASMGALRAAELEPFGMEGVGEIFDAFRDGTLTDDDEVALGHGLESGYRPLSEAMVNIRHTLAAAASAGVIRQETRKALEQIAKSAFYLERDYNMLLSRARDQGVCSTDLEAFRRWLPHGRVDQKRADALAMLRVIRARLAAGLEPKRVSFNFEYTDVWDHARFMAGELTADGTTVVVDALLEELRLDGPTYTRIRQGALARALAVNEAQRQCMSANEERVLATAEDFRTERGLLTSADTDRWMKEHHVGPEQWRRLIEDEARLRWVDRLAEGEVTAVLVDELRVTDEYRPLLERAHDKSRTLEAGGLENPSLDEVGLTEHELLRWYFEQRLHSRVPADVPAYARAVGFPDEEAFRRAVLRDHCYVRARGLS